MSSMWLAVGALFCAASVTAGAFGAHGLESRLDAGELGLWETAARYLMYGGLSLLVVGVVMQLNAQKAFGYAAVLLAVGSAVFSATIFALALGGPRWLGAVTPLGGAGMIAGLLLFAWTAFRL